jgi:hypothetical protein
MSFIQCISSGFGQYVPGASLYNIIDQIDVWHVQYFRVVQIEFGGITGIGVLWYH